MSAARIPFLSLRPGEEAADVRAAIERVVAGGWYVLGPEVDAFETEFAAAASAGFAIGAGTGTDAIALILRGLDIGAGDEVIVPPITAAYTALAVMMAGARPVFADVDPVRLTLDPDAAAAAITPRTRAILPVHLYGQAASMTPILAVAARHNLAVVEDCCQAHLATSEGRPVGTIGVAGAFSFYPTKNLGAMGDGGAVVTNDRALAERVRRLRNGGQTDRYHHVEAGVNSRLDEIQAAVLRARLPRLARWTGQRRALAARYRVAIEPRAAATPLPECDAGHVYHLFVLRSAARAELQRELAADGIETLVHYPVPVSRQPAFREARPATCPTAERACSEVLSVPLYPALPGESVDRVARSINRIATTASLED